MESTLVGKFGAAGVPIPYTEVLPALQRGTIDAVRSSIIVMGGSKFFTVTKSITVVESGMIPSVVMLSDIWTKKLSAKQRKFVLSTLTDMTDWNTKTAADFGTRAEKLWKDNGAEVIRLSAADQKTFMDTVRPLGDQFLGQHKNERRPKNVRSAERGSKTSHVTEISAVLRKGRPRPPFLFVRLVRPAGGCAAEFVVGFYQFGHQRHQPGALFS